MADGDIYLYNKPGGQGTGGKGNHILAARQRHQASVTLCVWGDGNLTETAQ